MEKERITYDLPFILLCVLAVMGGLKPEFLIPGLKAIGPIRQIPNILIGSLFLLWITQGEKVLHNKQTKLYLAFKAINSYDINMLYKLQSVQSSQ